MKKNMRTAAKALAVGAVAVACMAAGTGSASALDRSVLPKGYSLNIGDRLLSPMDSTLRQYELVLQSDGNLVEYRLDHGYRTKTCWASGTYGKPVHHATYQQDGNFVLYGNDIYNTAYWASNTVGVPGSTVNVNIGGAIYVGTKLYKGNC
ncbi:hypothetical protein [Kitasatospora terrestris]|uniref:Bulb-type lectin domain-containing protein n=1 Tax=Kitasatospora terrestris TaxID=258051 RepID=A0ABP9D931_9ACTN